MQIFKQRTLNEEIKFKGIGLHSGLDVNLTIKPSNLIQELFLKELTQKK